MKTFRELKDELEKIGYRVIMSKHNTAVCEVSISKVSGEEILTERMYTTKTDEKSIVKYLEEFIVNAPVK